MIKIKSKVTGLKQSKIYINKEGKKLGSDFQNELITKTRELAVKMQTDLNASIDRGSVPFTRNALRSWFKKSRAGVSCYIGVLQNQNEYLYDIIVEPKVIDKFVNTSAARLTKEGNISQLRSSIKNNKFKVVTSGGKKRLIDTTKKDTKRNTKRVIGLHESKKRKIIYDFYSEAEKGIRLIISDIQGHFSVKRG
ncbi:TPA: hypothetical protein ACK2W9_003797 [Klebsiella michiganensis]|jgi:hypothetical protein|uniref:hypothetical protein n=1 Tax=Klebsiella/Raoultella group TaxID=2890311 RepID=UPI000807468B|nr:MULTISPECIES: hypothetical protein [Klebsiella/Raoultella group]MDU4226410.1 hypothetical protein [Klebsiella grimontii]MDG9982322.1 hypothetical protein [Klebsiella michiganensis]MDH0832272.1 hypothetical protein [Klebsiella michiganensis]MDH0844899.1 hypothetical protein [Klebsiella michiganensis]MDQ2145315.1 hypothetical protein [Klebsiella michiganensis]